MDEFTISVVIADRPYRLTIRRNEEELIRKAASEINKKLKQYSENFAFKDKQDLLAMVALEKVTNALELEGMLQENERDILKGLSEIEEFLDQVN